MMKYGIRKTQLVILLGIKKPINWNNSFLIVRRNLIIDHKFIKITGGDIYHIEGVTNLFL